MARNENEISIDITQCTVCIEGQCHNPPHVKNNVDAANGNLAVEEHNNTDSVNINGSAASNGAAKKAGMDHSESTPLYLRSGNAGRGNCCAVLLSQLKWLLKLFFPSKTFTKFLVQACIPALAFNLIPLFFIGNIPNESALALAGQFVFISVIIEIIQEGIVNSLFHFVGRNYTLNRSKALQALKICLCLLVCLGSIFTLVMILLNSQFVKLIDTPESIVEATREFLYISAFSYPLFLVDAALNSFLLITTSSYLIYAQLSNVLLSFLCNFLLFGGQAFSLHWDVAQLGYYKIIQATLSCSNSLAFSLLVEKLTPWQFLFKVPLTHELKENFKDLFHVSWGNFGDSAVRNFFYFVVTLKFINNLGETEVAAWNLLNTIVWGLLLIPSFGVANYAKVRIGHQGSKAVIRRIAKQSFRCLAVWLTVVCLFSYFLWSHLASFFGKSNEGAQELSTKMLHEMGWIFVIFSFNNAMDSMFIGIGKTEYVFYQSFLTNLLVYFVPWLLYLFKVIQPSYWLVMGLYLAGMLVDFCLTVFFSFRVWNTIPE